MAMRAPYSLGYPVWRMITADKASTPALVTCASRFDIRVGLPVIMRYINRIALNYFALLLII